MKLESHTLCLLGLLVISNLNNMDAFAIMISQPMAAAFAQDTDFRPISTSQCQAFQQLLGQTLRVKVTQTMSPFQDYVNHRSGTGCLLTATGTGRKFCSPAAVVQKVEALFTKRGWGQEPAYAAAGAMGMAAGFSRSNTYALLRVEWRPASGIKCPSNQPIASCVLTPEQKLYTVTLNLAYTQPGPRQKHEQGCN